MAKRPTLLRADFDRRSVAALLALAVAAFCYVTVETAPVGLLESIAGDLKVPVSQIGLLVTGYAVTVVVVTLPLVKVVQRVPRRPLMLVLMAMMVVGTLLSAAAVNYGLLFAARVATALSQSVFWAIVAPVAAGMFPVRVRGRVMAVVFTGGSIGPMLGVPALTWLGQQAGWRASFVAIGGLGLIALVVLAAALPSGSANGNHAGRGTAPNVRRFVMLQVVTVLGIGGFFTFYTYTSSFITAVAGMSAMLLGPLLFARGIADFGGIALGGTLSDRNQQLALVTGATMLVATFVGLYAFGADPIATGAGVIATGLASGVFLPAIQNRVMEFAPGSTDTASAVNSVAFNVGIAIGSALGGLAVAHTGERSTALAAAILAAAALAVALTAFRGAGRGAAAPAALAEHR